MWVENYASEFYVSYDPVCHHLYKSSVINGYVLNWYQIPNYLHQQFISTTFWILTHSILAIFQYCQSFVISVSNITRWLPATSPPSASPSSPPSEPTTRELAPTRHQRIQTLSMGLKTKGWRVIFSLCESFKSFSSLLTVSTGTIL